MYQSQEGHDSIVVELESSTVNAGQEPFSIFSTGMFVKEAVKKELIEAGSRIDE